MGAVVDDAAEEGLALDALAHQAALHVGQRDHQRVDAAVADLLVQQGALGVQRLVVVARHGVRILRDAKRADRTAGRPAL